MTFLIKNLQNPNLWGSKNYFNWEFYPGNSKNFKKLLQPIFYRSFSQIFKLNIKRTKRVIIKVVTLLNIFNNHINFWVPVLYPVPSIPVFPSMLHIYLLPWTDPTYIVKVTDDFKLPPRFLSHHQRHHQHSTLRTVTPLLSNDNEYPLLPTVFHISIISVNKLYSL